MLLPATYLKTNAHPAFERGRTGVPPYSEMHGVLPSGLVDRDNKTRLTWTDLRTSPVFAKNLWSVLVNSLTVAWKPWVPTSTSQSLDPVSSIELQEWEGHRQGVHAQRTLVSHHYLARKIWTPPWYSDESNSNSARLDCWCQKRSTNTKIWLNMWFPAETRFRSKRRSCCCNSWWNFERLLGPLFMSNLRQSFTCSAFS